jgi:hypothetical protein
MALCSKCRKRLAKRSCAGLGGAICQLCCGTLREREIHCPPACPHLTAHKLYQERRIVERKPSDAGPGRAGRKDILSDERLAWLSLHIEAALGDHAKSHPDFADKDALLAVEYARERTNKGQGRLVIPGEAFKPGNAAGEAVLRAVEQCRYESSAILTTAPDAYTKDNQLACLERVASGIRARLDGKPEGHAYLMDLSRRFVRSGARSGEQKLITLG